MPARSQAAASGPERMLVAFAVSVSLGIAVVSGLAAGEGSKTLVVLPLVVGAGLLMGALGLVRFSTFVMILLVVRSSLDLARLSGPDGQAAAAALRLFDPSSMTALLFVAMAILWLGALRCGPHRVPGSSPQTALLVFLAAGVISILGSTRPVAGTHEALRIASAVLMFVAVEQLASDPARRRQVLGAVYLSAILPLAFSAFGLLTGTARTEPKGDLLRLQGTFVQSNDFGRYLMLLIIMGVALYPHMERRLRIPLAALLAAASWCLLLTYTLSAVIGTVVGLAIVGLLQSRRVVAGMLVAATLALVLLPGLSGRFGDLLHTGDSQDKSSLDWRVEYWATVLPLANENPITGIGLGQTQYLTEQEKQPHNDFIRAYVETGLIGLAAYTWMLLCLMALAWRAVKDNPAGPRGPLDRGLATGFLGCAASFLATSLVANLFSSVVVLWYFFAFAAAASAITADRTAAHGQHRHGTRALVRQERQFRV
ncbi:MAG: O-antigen ligase family protein [Egibacteraceae bacterium]